MRKKLIAGNWKMNHNASKTEEVLNDLVKMDLSKNVDVLICPSFTSLYMANKILKDSNIHLGAQNVSKYEDGAMTGEISTNMLRDIGVEYVIIGHSERRAYLNESNREIKEKIKRALDEGLKVILCVGENKYERDSKLAKEVVKTQVEEGLRGIKENIENLSIAYEPVWAIGTGNTCSFDEAENMCIYIREIYEGIYSKEEAEKVRILYGGSVKPANISEFMKSENIDGALVGGASLKAEDFSKLVNYEA